MNNVLKEAPPITTMELRWHIPEKVGDVVLYEITESLRYTVKGRNYTVPKGFISDGASFPKLLQGIFNPMGKYAPESILHDWLLKQGIPRPTCDLIFRDALYARPQGVSKLVRTVMFVGVRGYTGALQLIGRA